MCIYRRRTKCLSHVGVADNVNVIHDVPVIFSCRIHLMQNRKPPPSKPNTQHHVSTVCVYACVCVVVWTNRLEIAQNTFCSTQFISNITLYDAVVTDPVLLIS